MDLRSTRATFVRPPRLRISSCPATVALATARTHDRTIMFRLFTSQEEPRRLCTSRRRKCKGCVLFMQ